MNYNYLKDDIEKCFRKLNIKKDDTLYITGNISSFGNIKNEKLRELPELFFKIIKKKIGSGGTIIVPTHSFNLIKSKKIFNPSQTFSETGAFSNYILSLKKTVRQIHPYSSSSAIGKKANFICSNNTRHVYGPSSPFQRMIKLNTKFISLGMPVNQNCSQVHQAEFDMNVPYRYTKEFNHKIKIKNKLYNEKFYLFVLYKQYIKLKRNKNKKILKEFLRKEKIKKQKLGKNYIYCYDMKKFYQHTLSLLKKDIFAWMNHRPKNSSPFRK
jgi:aminoglycoside 3-N-acetyltransferase